MGRGIAYKTSGSHDSPAFKPPEFGRSTYASRLGCSRPFHLRRCRRRAANRTARSFASPRMTRAAHRSPAPRSPSGPDSRTSSRKPRPIARVTLSVSVPAKDSTDFQLTMRKIGYVARRSFLLPLRPTRHGQRQPHRSPAVREHTRAGEGHRRRGCRSTRPTICTPMRSRTPTAGWATAGKS